MDAPSRINSPNGVVAAQRLAGNRSARCDGWPLTEQLRTRIGSDCYDFVAYFMSQVAVDALERLYRPGFNYSKAEVMLLNL